MTEIELKIDGKYREHLDLIKNIMLDEKGEAINDDGKAVEVLIQSFMDFLNEQAEAMEWHEHVHGDDCCGHSH